MLTILRDAVLIRSTPTLDKCLFRAKNGLMRATAKDARRLLSYAGSLMHPGAAQVVDRSMLYAGSLAAAQAVVLLAGEQPAHPRWIADQVEAVSALDADSLRKVVQRVKGRKGLSAAQLVALCRQWIENCRKWALERELQPLPMRARLGLPPWSVTAILFDVGGTLIRERSNGGARARTEAARVLRLLRQRYRLAALSNGDRSVRDLLTRVGLGCLFDAIILSEEVGCGKPDPSMVSIAVESLGVPLTESVIVGDIFDSDIACARAAGVPAIWFWPHCGPTIWVDGVAVISNLMEVPSLIKPLRHFPRAAAQTLGCAVENNRHKKFDD
ncbi:MAG: HAD-IA family hydrolase [Bryobacteraceae bacterium]|jgi:HAD superfamily hydrolase (TIGR01509 family)